MELATNCNIVQKTCYVIFMQQLQSVSIQHFCFILQKTSRKGWQSPNQEMPTSPNLNELNVYNNYVIKNDAQPSIKITSPRNSSYATLDNKNHHYYHKLYSKSSDGKYYAHPLINTTNTITSTSSNSSIDNNTPLTAGVIGSRNASKSSTISNHCNSMSTSITSSISSTTTQNNNQATFQKNRIRDNEYRKSIMSQGSTSSAAYTSATNYTTHTGSSHDEFVCGGKNKSQDEMASSTSSSAHSLSRHRTIPSQCSIMTSSCEGNYSDKVYFQNNLNKNNESNMKCYREPKYARTTIQRRDSNESNKNGVYSYDQFNGNATPVSHYGTINGSSSTNSGQNASKLIKTNGAAVLSASMKYENKQPPPGVMNNNNQQSGYNHKKTNSNNDLNNSISTTTGNGHHNNNNYSNHVKNMRNDVAVQQHQRANGNNLLTTINGASVVASSGMPPPRYNGTALTNHLHTGPPTVNQQHLHSHSQVPPHLVNTLSSPESAYSTGYSTDGTSPGKLLSHLYF